MPLDQGDLRKVPADPRGPHNPNPHRESRGFSRNLELISPTPHAAEGEPRPVRDAAAASRFSTIGASWACPPLALVVEQRVPRAWALVLYRGPQ